MHRRREEYGGFSATEPAGCGHADCRAGGGSSWSGAARAGRSASGRGGAGGSDRRVAGPAADVGSRRPATAPRAVGRAVAGHSWPVFSRLRREVAVADLLAAGVAQAAAGDGWRTILVIGRTPSWCRLFQIA